VGLSDEIAECLRAPLAGYDLVAHFAFGCLELPSCFLNQITKTTSAAQAKINVSPMTPARSMSSLLPIFALHRQLCAACFFAVRGTSGDLRHPRQSRYRCSLPGLAGFAGPRCTEPEVPRSGSRALRAAAGLSLTHRILSCAMPGISRRSILIFQTKCPARRSPRGRSVRNNFMVSLLPPVHPAVLPRKDSPSSL